VLSVGDGFMIAMAAARIDTTTAISGDVVLPRRRGKSKAPNFKYEGPVSVIRLELDASDPVVRRGLERQWAAMFRLRRALQRDAQHLCRAYWAAHHERRDDPKGLRERLGLSRKGIEAAAKSHIEASGWMRDHLTKAVGLHVADEVWETVDRHLFTDASGRRHGPPRIGSWWDFARIPGRARSHTKATPVWETWRLVGTLNGHLEAYRHRRLPAAVSTVVAEPAGQPTGTSILAQPPRLAAPRRPASGRWTDHHGVLAVVFTGLPGGDVVLSVRLPQGAGQWAHLSYYLADPSVWHKIDLVRVRDRKAPGAWRYYAHLLTHQRGYQSAATRTRRVEIPTGRRAGVDANVSNLALASFPDDHPERLATHGNIITVEDCSISTWARRWGKRIALFSPGMLVAALKHECEAAGGRLYRAGTRSTALSQHCLCGARLPKTLAQRIHHCSACGLHGDRDNISAALAACVTLTDPDDPRTAHVDYRLAHALQAWLASQQEWEGSVNRHQPPTPRGVGSARTGSHHPPVASAEQAALGPPPNRPSRKPGRRGTSRKQPVPKLIGAA
jgi:hypothetical protein